MSRLFDWIYARIHLWRRRKARYRRWQTSYTPTQLRMAETLAAARAAIGSSK